ncbi:Protein of unknown function [Pyronema omphalodes CBS 100304]|uniref:Uncharacterized protein n=1 Tax=Pyronema omphalodes (strain CBS 100304) TaxID=1076935 RepID=U4L500_PYROM|nr:Protein of unknown function [Pyronema omphalodes CBS 100304]
MARFSAAPLNKCLIPSEEEEHDEFLAKVAKEEEEMGEPIISREDIKGSFFLVHCLVIVCFLFCGSALELSHDRDECILKTVDDPFWLFGMLVLLTPRYLANNSIEIQKMLDYWHFRKNDMH